MTWPFHPMISGREGLPPTQPRWQRACSAQSNKVRFRPSRHELEEFGIYRDTVERAFDADVTKGLYVFEGKLYFGVTGSTSQIYTVRPRELAAMLKTDGEA
jgi:hypothetical protein